MKLIPLVLLMLGVAACQPDQTEVLIAIDASGLTISQLTVTVTLSGIAKTESVPSDKLPGTLRVLLPPVATAVTVSASAVDSQGTTWTQSATTTSIPHHSVDLALHLGDGGDDLGGPNLPPADLAPYLPADLAPRQPVLSLLAGAVGGAGDVDGKGSAARMSATQAVAIAGDVVYVTEMYSGLIRKVAADGTTTTVPLVDHLTGSPVALDYGVGLAWDGTQYLYAGEWNGCSIQRIDPTSGATTRVSGSGGGSCGFLDGNVDNSQVKNPNGIAIDATGLVWIADSGNAAIRTFDPTTGLLATAAGTGVAGNVDGSGGTGGSARFTAPIGITTVGTKVYVTDGALIRAIDRGQPVTSSTYVTTVVPGGADGFYALQGIAGGDGSSLLAIDGDNVIHRVVPGTPPTYTIVAGSPYAVGPFDGAGTVATLQSPSLMASDGKGTVWFADGTTVRTLALGAPWTVATVAGVGNYQGGSANTPNWLDDPAGLAWDGGDNVYIADYDGNRIRKFVRSTGALSVLAGSGDLGHTDDTGLAASFSGPSGLALDASGHLFVADRVSGYIRKITIATGVVQTVAGSGTGAAPALDEPTGLAFDGDHTLYIGDLSNNLIRTLDTGGGALGVLAGTGVAGNHDDVAASATFWGPGGLAFDHTRKLLYVADSYNNLIRQIDLTASGTPVSVVSGTGANSYVDNTTLTAATYYGPINLVLDEATRTLYVADFVNNAVRKLDLVGNHVTTRVGDGTGRTTPGPLPANIHGPWGLALSDDGLLVTSYSENTLLVVR